MQGQNIRIRLRPRLPGARCQHGRDRQHGETDGCARARPHPAADKIEVHRVLGPHIDGRAASSSDRTYKRLLDIVDPTPQTVDADEARPAAGVDVEIKL